MKSHDLVRVKHMIEAADEAISFAQGRNRGDLNKDRMLTVALMREIEAVGEAASNISEDFKLLHPEIPWALIIGMRNKLNLSRPPCQLLVEGGACEIRRTLR